jgi:hypothetical protein
MEALPPELPPGNPEEPHPVLSGIPLLEGEGKILAQLKSRVR